MLPLGYSVLLCIRPVKVTQSHGCGRMYFYGVGINERVDSCYKFGMAEGLNEHFTASKTEVHNFQ